MNSDVSEASVGGLNAEAIRYCLQFLARSAALLELPRTLTAIEDALEAATQERTADRIAAPSPRAILH